jgi:hypothetical protein
MLTSVSPWVVFLVGSLAMSVGMVGGTLLTVRRVATEDDGRAKISRHQRDPRGRGPASLDWVPDPPARTRVPRGETVLWNPRTDTMTPVSAVDLPMNETSIPIDYRKGS